MIFFSDQIYAAFEYAPKSNLRNFLRTQAIKDKEDLDEPEVLTRERLLEFAFDVASGMNFLANKQVLKLFHICNSMLNCLYKTNEFIFSCLVFTLMGVVMQRDYFGFYLIL